MLDVGCGAGQTTRRAALQASRTLRSRRQTRRSTHSRRAATTANEWFTALTGALSAARTPPPSPAGGPHPFGLAEPSIVRPILQTAGFGDIAFEALGAPMYFGTDADDAERSVLGLLGWLLADVDAQTHARAFAALRETLRAHVTSAGVQFASSTWIITARRAS